MAGKIYGGNKTMYRVIEKANDRIEVQVCHENNAVRKIIEDKRTNPRFFVEHYENWREAHIRAKFWMAKVVSEYRPFFQEGRVDFVLVEAGVKDISAEELKLVVGEYNGLTGILKRRFGVKGRGLIQLANNVCPPLPTNMIENLNKVADVRNGIVHEEGITLASFKITGEEFHIACKTLGQQLNKIADRRAQRKD